MRPELHDEKMDAKAEAEIEAWEAMMQPINQLILNWGGSEEMEVYNQLAPRLNFIVPFQLQPFVGAIYKMGYADGSSKGD